MSLNILGGFFENITIGNVSLKEIKKRGSITLNMPIDNNTLDQITKYLCTPIIVILKPDNSFDLDEKEYFNNVENIIKTLGNQKRDYVIRIIVKNRELFRKRRILTNLPNNIILSINASENIYTLKEYQSEEDKIENMVSKIRSADLSPFEKFLAVYDIVKNYKPYNGIIGANDESFHLNRILDDKNEFIVCAGYARLLEELLIRVNIPCKRISVNIDSSYIGGFTKEEKNVKYNLHSRNLVKIDDDKYNIHGIYISDSTWDNNRKYNLYLHSLLTFDRKKEADRLESLEDEDLLLDFHSIQEFIDKIKFYIKKNTSRKNITPQMEEHLRTQTYKNLYLKIMEILTSLDKEKSIELFNKYNDKLNIYTININSQDLEQELGKFLIDYAKYIMPLVNNKINNMNFITALINIQKTLYLRTDEDIKKYIDKLTLENKLLSEVAFPYIYDASMKEGYVEARHKK